MAHHPTHEELTKRLIEFRDARDWRQFHSLKDLILSLNLEAAELLELTQWQEASAFEAASGEEATKQRLAEECADVFLYLLLICERAGINLSDAASAKILQNANKYPVDKSRGSATKYDKF